MHGETVEFVMYLALETNQWVAILVGAACLAALVAIVVTPSKRVRAEPPIPDDVETRLLLGESPERIVEEEVQEEEEGPAGPRGEVFDLDPERHSSPLGLVRQGEEEACLARHRPVDRHPPCPHPPRALSRSSSTVISSTSPGCTSRRQRTFSTPPKSGSFPA